MEVKHKEYLRLGIIQTNVDNRTAWNYSGKPRLRMNPYAELMVMEEIRKGFFDINDRHNPPQIILLPEYSIPLGGLPIVERYAKAISSVIIGGLDVITNNKTASNKGVVIVPNRWPCNGPSYTANKVYFGKTFFSHTELIWFDQCGVKPKSAPVNYILDAGEYGNIGIAICADFYDLERFVLYKGRIHHLFIISYNQDYKSFECLAEAISRLLMCNVVICNTGLHGDSLAYSPYKEDYKRVIYKNAGANLFSTQIVELPVRALDSEQTNAHDRFAKNVLTVTPKPVFKWPPGYRKYSSY